MSEIKSSMNSCSTSSPIRVHFSDVTNKQFHINNMIDDDRRWKLLSGKYEFILFSERMKFLIFY